MFVFYVNSFLHSGRLVGVEESWVYRYCHKPNESVWIVPGTIKE